ncbi:zinc finger protein [Artemisia annua]|uniref:Zinc finger protein n=1 Tax=Artemisia annua TaxID=35608 RepID=A0A2U1P2B7_ARTAN|nr:zinc finger protein [Artemisia annua]
MIDLSEDEDVDDEVQVRRKESKKRKFVGASNVCGPLDSILKNDHGKINQGTSDKNNPIKQKLKMVAWKKIATWAYAVGLPFNAVRDESFQDMINAIGDYGKSGCFLNPVVYHRENSNLDNNSELTTSLYAAIDKLVPDPEENDTKRWEEMKIGPSTRSKRERYRDDDDEISIEEEDLGLGYNLDEEVNALDDVDSDVEPVDCD